MKLLQQSGNSAFYTTFSHSSYVRYSQLVQRVDATLSLIKWDVAMKQRTRINYTPEQKAIIWNRYKQGDSMHDFARYVR